MIDSIIIIIFTNDNHNDKSDTTNDNTNDNVKNSIPNHGCFPCVNDIKTCTNITYFIYVDTDLFPDMSHVIV